MLSNDRLITLYNVLHLTLVPEGLIHLDSVLRYFRGCPYMLSYFINTLVHALSGTTDVCAGCEMFGHCTWPAVSVWCGTAYILLALNYEKDHFPSTNVSCHDKSQF